jgi:hypothetical protein
MKNTLSFLIALAVIVSPGLIDKYLPTIDFLTPSMEKILNLIK